MSSTSAIHPCISTTANNSNNNTTTTTTTNTTTTTATTNTTSYFANAPLQYDENECPATPGTATMTKASTAMMFDFTSPPSSSSCSNEQEEEEQQKQEEKQQQLGQNNYKNIEQQPLKLSITTTAPTLSLKTKASRPTPIHTSLLNHPTTSHTNNTNNNNNNVVPPISKLSTNTHRLSSPVVTTALPSPTSSSSSSSSSSCSPSPLSLRLSQRPQSSGAKSLCSVPSCVSQRKLAGRLSGSSSTTTSGAVGGGNGDGSKGRSPYVRPVDHSSTSNQQVCRILDGALVKRDELIRIRSCGTPNSASHVQRQHLNSMFVASHSNNNNNGDVGSGDQQTPLSPLPTSSPLSISTTTTTTMTSNNVFCVQRREDGAAPSPPTTPTTNVTSSTTTSTAIATSTARKNMLANRKAAVRKNISLSVVTCQHSIDV